MKTRALAWVWKGVQSFYCPFSLGILSVRLIHRGLSLIEITIVLTLISVMMALSLPMLSVANARARSELCQQNLIEIGQVIVGHAQDNDHLPTLYNLSPTQAGLSLPEFIEPRLHIPKVVFCPSDETETSQVLGTSYRWGMAFNDQKPGAMWGMVGQPLLADREAYHLSESQPVNEMVVIEDDTGIKLSLIGKDSKNSTPGKQPDLYFKKKQKNPKNPQHPNHPPGDDD